MFTNSQIEEIYSKLKILAKKDSQFPLADAVVDENDTSFPVIQYIPALQDYQNKLMSFNQLRNILVGDSGSSQRCILTITSSTSGAKIYVNNSRLVGTTYTGNYGTIALIKVEATGYDTEYLSVTLTQDATINVGLTRSGISSVPSMSIKSLSDVNSSMSPSEGQVLKYVNGQWTNANDNSSASAAVIYTGGNGVNVNNNTRVISLNYQSLEERLIEDGFGQGGGGEDSQGGKSYFAGQGLALTNNVFSLNQATAQSLGGVRIPNTRNTSISNMIVGGNDRGDRYYGVEMDNTGKLFVYVPWVASEGGGGGGGDDPTPTPVITDYVTLTTPQSISGSKTFQSRTNFLAPIWVGDSTSGTKGQGAQDATKRIYFDDSHYIELNTNGYYFCGAGIYTGDFISAGGLSSGGAGGGFTLAGLDDTDFERESNPLVNGSVLMYSVPAEGEEGEPKWIPATVSGIGSYLPTDGSGIMTGYVRMQVTSTMTSPYVNGLHFEYSSGAETESQPIIGGVGGYRASNGQNILNIYTNISEEHNYSGIIRLRPGASSYGFGLTVTESSITHKAKNSDDGELSLRKVFWGTCSTAASTRKKIVMCDQMASGDLKNGTVLYVMMQNGYTASAAPTIQVRYNYNGNTYNTGDEISAYKIFNKQEEYPSWGPNEIVQLVYFVGPNSVKSWVVMPTYNYIDSNSGSSTSSIQPATANRLGGVKIGSGINVTNDGTISVTGGGSSYTIGEGLVLDNNKLSLAVARTDAVGGGKVYRVWTSNPAVSVSNNSAGSNVRNYGVERTQDGRLFVNVPWVSGSGGGGGTAGVTSWAGLEGTISASDAITALEEQLDGSMITAEEVADALSGYLPLTAGNGSPLTGTLYAQTIVPTANTYDLGDSSHSWNRIYLGKNGNQQDVYIQYDSSIGAVRVYNAGIVSSSFISAGGVSTTPS